MKPLERECVVVALMGLLAASSVMSAGAGSAPQPLAGRWAGDRLRLTIDATGGRIEGDCASGQFAGPVLATVDGRFSAQGRYTQRLPGPQREEAEASTVAPDTRFSGELRDNVMKLSIFPAGADEPQVFTLLSGARLKLIRCL